MESVNPFWEYWYFHIPNFVLAALIYTLIGRIVLGVFFVAGSPNYIWRAFCRLTDPVLAAVRVVTPLAIGPLLLLPLAAFWLFLLRLALFIAFAALGLMPRTGL